MKSDSKEKQILKNIFLTVDMAPILHPLLDMIFLFKWQFFTLWMVILEWKLEFELNANLSKRKYFIFSKILNLNEVST